MIYAILMAAAFIGAASLITILIVTKKRDNESYEPDEEYEAVYPPAEDGKGPKLGTDRREAVFNGQKVGREDFGYSESNPICTASVPSGEKYLALLRTEYGEPLQWIREGTISVHNLHGAGPVNEEVYTLYLHGEAYRKLYICPYGRNSAHVPVGLALASNGEPAPYGGSILAEAREKGITEQQVLAKQARIDESQPNSIKQDDSFREKTVLHEKSSETGKKSKEASESPSSASFPSYLPGFEPDNVKPALERFLAVMEREFPDHQIPGSSWNHEKWDKAASMLCKVLGYSSGSEFLEAYGFKVEKDR